MHNSFIYLFTPFFLSSQIFAHKDVLHKADFICKYTVFLIIIIIIIIIIMGILQWNGC